MEDLFNHRTAGPLPLLALAKLPRMMFSFEALFILFLFAGRYKTDARLAWVPIDLTGLFWSLSLIAGAYVFFFKFKSSINKHSVLFSLGMLLLVAWVLLSLSWTVSRRYAFRKTFYLSTLVLWAAFGPALIIARNPERLQRFFTLIFGFSAWTLVESMVLLWRQGGIGFIKAFGANYLALGSTLGLGSAVALVHYLYHADRLGARVFYTLFLGSSLFMMIAGGGRGPLLGLIFVIVAVGLLTLRQMMHRYWMTRTRFRTSVSLFLVIGILALLAATVDLSRMQTIRRIQILFTEQNHGASAELRAENYRYALEYWKQSPLVGHGIGSYPILRSGSEKRDYPHNLFLELMTETGLIGLAIVVFLIFSCYRAYRSVVFEPTSYGVTAFAIAVLCFLFSQLSGDITDNRYLFMSLGLFSGIGGQLSLSRTTVKHRTFFAALVRASLRFRSE